MKGYVIVQDKEEIVPDGDIHMKVEDALTVYYRVKDDFWDVLDRDEVTWYIVNLKNGKSVKLQGWKTRYPRYSRSDYEYDCPHEYNKSQIKRLKGQLR